jgi:hypothetical protein
MPRVSRLPLVRAFLFDLMVAAGGLRGVAARAGADRENERHADRSGRNAARTSFVNSSGSSQAAK